MDKQGKKTGGRQKGTPNKINASVKVRIKDFLIKTEDAMMDAFMQAKPNEKLNFWFKMANFICAKQTSSKDDGEWRPGEGIFADWSTNDEWYQEDLEEQYNALWKNKKNEQLLKEQAAYARAFNECKELISTLSPNGLKEILQHFPSEDETRIGLYTFLKNLLDRKVNDALETIKENGDIQYSQEAAPKPLNPVNPLYDKVDNTTAESTKPLEQNESLDSIDSYTDCKESELVESNLDIEQDECINSNLNEEPNNSNNSINSIESNTTNKPKASISKMKISPFKKAQLKKTFLKSRKHRKRA